jgi:WD40 repeat protein
VVTAPPLVAETINRFVFVSKGNPSLETRIHVAHEPNSSRSHPFSVGPKVIKVLLFAANPRGTAPLDLPREFREIDEEVRRAAYRDKVELILVPGTRPVDLLRKLNENQPQVIHLSGHGNPDEIILETGDEEAEAPGRSGTTTGSTDDRNMDRVRPDAADDERARRSLPQVLSKSALVSVLRSCDEGNLRLVVLNACHTRSQAEALTKVVDCVVSMNRSISDGAAIKFAASFYGALAFGRSVQKAFDQGVARLHAEGMAETGTPELLVRAGIDGSRVILVGEAPTKPGPPTAEAPFIVPFPRNADFVGRDGDLSRLHASLSGPTSGPVGIRPAGLTGMGGIGKTQLAVEYVHGHRGEYPGGIFWIDAAGPLADGFARLATDHRLRWAENDRPRDEQVREAFAALDSRPHALLVLDNVPDPGALAVPVLPDYVPEDLRCRLLFTTRRHDLGRFAGVELTVLAVSPALRLLLRHPSRRAALDPADPNHEHARAITRMLGRLPLALELAGAYLGKYSGDVSLGSYREGLRSDGALATLDADAAELTEADLRRVHDPAVAATIGEQWGALGDEPARLLLRVASLFPESSAVPIARLSMLAGLAVEARSGRLSPFRRAVKRLEDACLVERLEADRLRLHPLIREFAAGRMSPDQVDEFRHQCLERAAAALEHFPTLEAMDVRRGVDGLQEDLIAILELCPTSAADLGARLQALLRLLQREAHNLRVGDQQSRPTLFAQQVRNRAFVLGISQLQSTAEQRLTALGRPHFRLLWTASRESRDLIRTLTGHGDWVSAVAVSPDSRHALTGSGDHLVRLWDLRTGQLLRTIAGHEAGVSAVSVSPDGRHALSGSHDRTLRLWDLQTGRLLRTLGGHDGMVFALAMSPDGQRALSGSHDNTVRLWDLRTGEILRTFTGHEDGVCAVAISPDGRSALSGSRDRTLKLWDLQTGRLLHTLAGHEGMVFGVAISPDGRHALSGSDDRTVKLWDLQTGRDLRTLAGHDDGVTAVAVSPDGHHALSGSHDRTLRSWDLQTGELLRTFAGHEHGVMAVAISPDGRHGLSGSDDRTVKLWDLVSGQSQPISTGHEGPVVAVAVSPDGRHALSGSYDRTLRYWDLATGALLQCVEIHETTVSALAIFPGGRHALSGSYDGSLRIWELQTGRLLRTFPGLKDALEAVTPSPDGGHTLSSFLKASLFGLWHGQFDEQIPYLHRKPWAYGSRTIEEMLIRVKPSHSINAVAVTSTGGCALSGLRDGTLQLWDRHTGELMRSFVGHTDAVHAVAVAPDDRHALSGSADCTLLLWRMETGELLQSFTEHGGPVTALAICPDGRHAVSGSRDRTLRLWDLEERGCRAIVPLESAPLAVALASDGRTVVVGDRFGNVHCFQIHVK